MPILKKKKSNEEHERKRKLFILELKKCYDERYVKRGRCNIIALALFSFFFSFFFVELRRSTFFFLWLQSACKSFPLFSYTNANEADSVLYLLHPHDIPCSFLFSSVLSELMVKQRQLFIAPNDVTVDFFVLLFFFFFLRHP